MVVDSNSNEPTQTSDHNGVTIPPSTTCNQDENTPPSGIKNFEDVLEDLGCFGPYQVLVLISYLFLEISAAFVAFISICVGKSTSTFDNCQTEHEFELLHDNQSYSTSSNLTTYYIPTTVIQQSLLESFRDIWDSPFKYESIVDEWDLKCDRAWITDIFTTFLMAGMMFGGLFWSAVADWYGRRKAYLSVLLVLFSGTFLSAISPNVYIYAIARFIAGSGFAGFCNVSSMTVIEFMTPKWRSLANVVGVMGEGVILLSVLGYYIKPWRQLYLATLFPYVLIIPLYFLLPESPRWLLRNKRVNAAYSVFENMAKMNKRPIVSMETLEKMLNHEDLATDESQQKQRISYVDFLRSKHLRKPTIFLLSLWFSWNVSYYGISYNIRNVPGDPYFNLGLIGLAIALGQRSSMVACNRFGRRRAVLFGMTLSAVFLVILAICFLILKTVSPTIILVGCFVGLFGMACTKASLRLLSGESYPTSVRTMGLGLGDMGANSAGLLTPQAAYLGSRWPALPFFIFAVISVFGSLVVFKMKETSGNPLSDEIELTIKKKTSCETKCEGQP